MLILTSAVTIGGGQPIELEERGLQFLLLYSALGLLGCTFQDHIVVSLPLMWTEVPRSPTPWRVGNCCAAFV